MRIKIFMGMIFFLSCSSNTRHTEDTFLLPEMKVVKVADNGCRMATAYIDCNKIVSAGEYFYFVYLAFNGGLYDVVIQGIKKDLSERLPPCIIASTVDNHGAPCIAVDGRGYIYVMYDGHSNIISLVRSKKPYDISDWENDIAITYEGRTLTYPVMDIVDDNLFVLLRTSPIGGDEGAILTFFTKHVKSDYWTSVDIFKGNHDQWRADKEFEVWVNGYNRFYANLAVNNDRIHVSFQCQEYLPISTHDNLVLSSYCLGYLYSDDCGKTWYKSNGKRLENLPVCPREIVLVAGEADGGSIYPDYQASNLVIFNNIPMFCYTKRFKEYTELCVAELENGVWKEIKIDYREGKNRKIGYNECSFSIDKKGNKQILIPLVNENDFINRIYGGESTSLEYMVFDILGNSWVEELLSKENECWLPNFGKSKGTENCFLFTKGIKDGISEVYFGLVQN